LWGKVAGDDGQSSWFYCQLCFVRETIGFRLLFVQRTIINPVT
jgi:hypothetical protein